MNQLTLSLISFIPLIDQVISCKFNENLRFKKI